MIVFRKIDPDALRAMWEAGTPTADIADQIGVTDRAVRWAVAKIGLPPRPRGGSPRRAAPPPDQPPPPAVTGYARIAEIAARDGITLTQAMQRWHRTRRTA